MASLEARHRARRLVMKAVLRLMERHGVDDDEAYRRLRKESMRLRITVEVSAAGSSTSTARRRRRPNAWPAG